MKYLFQGLAGVILVVVGKYLASQELKPHFVAEGLILLITIVIVEIGYDIYANWKRIGFFIRCFILRLNGKFIRFSMSYQYRIKVGDRYLLVKNSNWDSYQHVGGKYKRLQSTQIILQGFGAMDDIKLPTNRLTKDDLAVFIPAKNAVKFLDWFNHCKDREISHWREFYEELIEGKAKVLSQTDFPYVNYNYVGRIRTPLLKTERWDCYEILQYDVLDLLPSNKQLAELEALLAKGDSDYIKWADYGLIQRLGYDERERRTPYNISPHAKWIINLKWGRES